MSTSEIKIFKTFRKFSVDDRAVHFLARAQLSIFLDHSSLTIILWQTTEYSKITFLVTAQEDLISNLLRKGGVVLIA